MEKGVGSRFLPSLLPNPPRESGEEWNYWLTGVGCVSAVGCTLLSMITETSLRSLSRPLVTTARRA